MTLLRAPQLGGERIGDVARWAGAFSRRFPIDPPLRRCARSLNIELQAALNPAGERKVERFGWTFAPGDKVMQIENDYGKEVYNGDIGYIVDVDPETGELVASFDGHSVTYGFGELDTLVPAYAATIHKSQGSEYPAVIIPVLTQHYPDAAAKSPLHWRHPRKAARGSRRPEEGHRHRRPQCFGPATLVEARRVAPCRRALPIVEFIKGGLNLSKVD